MSAAIINKLLIILCTLSFFLASGPAMAGDDTEKAGDILLAALPATAYGMTFMYDNSEGREQFYRSLATTAVITYGLKKTATKRRPNGEDTDSFPSGHTSVTFSSAAFIQKRYGWEYGLPAFAAAAFTGWSRIESDNHHVEDVLVGAAIGTVSSYYFTTPSKEDIHVSPLIGEKAYGLMIHGNW